MSAKSKINKYQIGDLIWAKMKGFPPWPGLVSEPSKELAKIPKKNENTYCVFFFGSNNYSWIEATNIWPYEELKDKGAVKGSKLVAFREACDAIEQYIQKKGNSKRSFDKLDVEDPFDKLLSDDSSQKTSKPKKRESSQAEGKNEEGKKTPVGGSSRKISTLSDNRKSPIPGDSKKTTPSMDAKRTEIKRKSTVPGSSSAKTTKTKRSVSPLNESTPAVNGETPVKRRKSNADYSVTNSISRSFSRSPSVGSDNRSFKDSSPEPSEDSVEVGPNSSALEVSQMDTSVSQSFVKIGIIGLGVIGSRIAKHLIESGYKVMVWNRSKDKSQKFSEVGVPVAHSPGDLVDNVDIILSCVAGPIASRSCVMNSEGGLITRSLSRKIYVEMATIDIDTARDLDDIVHRCGGQYIEAQIQGGRAEVDSRDLVLVCAGNRSAFEKCLPIFEVFSSQSFFIGHAGLAVKTNLLLQMFRGVSLGGLAEGVALAERAGHSVQDLQEILKVTEINSPFMEKNLDALKDGTFTPNHALKYLQNDINLGLLLSDITEHPLPLTATANEVYKHAKRLGYRDADITAVYLRARF